MLSTEVLGCSLETNILFLGATTIKSLLLVEGAFSGAHMIIGGGICGLLGVTSEDWTSTRVFELQPESLNLKI